MILSLQIIWSYRDKFVTNDAITLDNKLPILAKRIEASVGVAAVFLCGWGLNKEVRVTAVGSAIGCVCRAIGCVDPIAGIVGRLGGRRCH